MLIRLVALTNGAVAPWVLSLWARYNSFNVDEILKAGQPDRSNGPMDFKYGQNFPTLYTTYELSILNAGDLNLLNVGEVELAIEQLLELCTARDGGGARREDSW